MRLPVGLSNHLFNIWNLIELFCNRSPLIRDQCVYLLGGVITYHSLVQCIICRYKAEPQWRTSWFPKMCSVGFSYLQQPILDLTLGFVWIVRPNCVKPLVWCLQRVPPPPYLLSCRAARKLQGHWSEGPQVGLHDQVKVGDVGLSHEGQAGERGQRGGVRALWASCETGKTDTSNMTYFLWLPCQYKGIFQSNTNNNMFFF